MVSWIFRARLLNYLKVNGYLDSNYTIINKKTVKINELPIGVWTSNYKEMLDNMVNITGTTKGPVKTQKIST